MLTLQLSNNHFVIPPEAPAYRVEAQGTFRRDVLLLGFFPDMRLRGKRFEYNLIPADPKLKDRPPLESETLLRVHYDPRRPIRYTLTTPRVLTAGDHLQAIARYDNSATNPHNPDANTAVRSGNHSNEEILGGFIDVAVPPDSPPHDQTYLTQGE